MENNKITNMENIIYLIDNTPSEYRCMRCGKHENELQPFDERTSKSHRLGKGVKLIMRDRPVEPVPLDEELEDILFEIFLIDDLDKASFQYGDDLVDKALEYKENRADTAKSWECRDCFFKE